MLNFPKVFGCWCSLVVVVGGCEVDGNVISVGACRRVEKNK